MKGWIYISNRIWWLDNAFNSAYLSSNPLRVVPRGLCHRVLYFSQLAVNRGHNTLGSHDPLKKIRITPPGLPYIQFSTISGHPNHSTINCQVVGTLYSVKNGDMTNDIAVLHAGSYHAAHYIKLGLASDVTPGGIINVIEYPGQQEWLLLHEGLKDIEASRCVADIMFPARRWIVRSGPIVKSFPRAATVKYKLFTVRGMTCVIRRLCYR